MKSALLLSGKIGGTTGKNGKGSLVDFVKCAKLFQKNIIEPNNCDVFLHSWSVEQRNELEALYHPVDVIFEPQINFNINGHVLFRSHSKWYSIKETIKLKTLYESHSNSIYDWVMIARFDLMILEPFIFESLNSKLLHLPNLAVFSKKEKRKRWEIPPQRNISLKTRKLHDIYFIGTSEMIDKFLKFRRQKRISANMHLALWNDVTTFIGDPNKSVNFLGWRGQEWDLYRWRVCHSEI